MTKVYTSLGKVRSTGVAVAFAVAAICVSFQFSADARAAQSAQELTEAAKRQAAEAKERAAKLKPATVSNQKRVEEVAETGRERGQAEFERRAALERAKHDAAVAKAGADEAGTEAKPKAPPTELSGRLVVAISSSMPDDLVREGLSAARALSGQRAYGSRGCAASNPLAVSARTSPWKSS
jgi:hypothetical protein